MILVTGGAGVMGSKLTRGLVERGERVRVIALPNDPGAAKLAALGGVEVHAADITDPASLQGAFDGIKTVYHLAAVLVANDPAVYHRVNALGTRNVVDASLRAGVEHFILVSSIAVNHREPTPYSLSKREAERIVTTQDRMRYTIVRPTLAYNETGGLEFMMFMNALLKYPVVPFIGFGRALKKPVHVDDLVRGFLAIANNPKSYGKTYNFCGPEEITMWDLGKLMLKHKGVSKPFVPVPLFVWRLVAAVAERAMKNPPITWHGIANMMHDTNPDESEARRDLGYNPIGVREGMQRTFPLPTAARPAGQHP